MVSQGGSGVACRSRRHGSDRISRGAKPTGVVFENVRIFDRSSDRLTEPSNVLIVGNIIKGSVPDHDRGTCGGDGFLPQTNSSRR